MFAINLIEFLYTNIGGFNMEKIMLYIISIFFIIGILDYIMDNKFRLGTRLIEGIQSMGTLALSMIGILSITPIISSFLINNILPILKDKNFIDPSIISSSILAVDMGGYKIANSISTNQNIIYFSGILISSIVGCTISFTLPLALGIVEEKDIDILCKGILCGLITLPISLFIGGVLLKIDINILINNILPIIILSIIIIIGIYKFPKSTISVFKVISKLILIVSILGLGLQGINSITGQEIIKNLLPVEDVLSIVGKIAIFLSGANVMIEVINRLFYKRINSLAKTLKINSYSITALIGSLASAVIVFNNFDKLDKRGKIICSAFSVGGAYVLGGQLGYVVTEAKEIVYIYIFIKLLSGILALVLSLYISREIIE